MTRVLIALASLLALGAGLAEAQPCLTCRTERCPAKEGLEDWCGAGADPLARARRPAHRPEHRAACEEGRAASARTAGHCCWPGQSWARDRGCFGIPATCPEGSRADGEQCIAAPVPAPVPAAPCPKEMALIRTPAADDQLRALCVDRAEVTAAEWERCAAEHACPAAGAGARCNQGEPARRDHPINCVDVEAATTYCRSREKRLPTVREWRAAAGASRSRPFPWGTAAPTREACWGGDGQGGATMVQAGTCAVGGHPAGDSPNGLHDLAGNVAEWTAPSAAGSSMAFGGSWGTFDGNRLSGNVAVEIEDARTRRSPYVGFRCVRDPR